MLNNKNGFQASLYTGTSGFEAQFGYALLDNVGIMINGSFLNSSSDSSKNFHKHAFGEIGGGYFNKLGNNFVYDAYGGVGYGSFNSYFNNELWTSYADVFTQRIFLQPSIGIVSDIIDVNFASRFVHLNLFKEGSHSYGLFSEPTATLKVGYKNFKFVGQFGLCFPIHKESIDFNYRPLLLSVGININFGKLST